MGHFFSADGKFYRFITRFWDVVKLNFCWFLCCVPIVTFGASTVAAYSVTLKMVDDEEGYVCRQFFKAFRKNLKQGIPLGLIFMALCYVIWFSFSNYDKLDSTLLLIGGIIVSFFTFLYFVFAFPLSARYENTLFHTIKNSEMIAIRYFGRTVFLTALLAIEAFVFLWFSETFFNLFIFIVGPICFMLTISQTAMRCFREIEKTGGVMPPKEELQEQLHNPGVSAEILSEEDAVTEEMTAEADEDGGDE